MESMINLAVQQRALVSPEFFVLCHADTQFHAPWLVAFFYHFEKSKKAQTT